MAARVLLVASCLLAPTHQLLVPRKQTTKHGKAQYAAIRAPFDSLSAGKYAECELRVVPWDSPFTPGYTAYPHAFQFAHRSELDKKHGVSKLVASHRTFHTIKPKIDKEVARCRMLCQCCGHVETLERASEPGASEEGN